MTTNIIKYGFKLNKDKDKDKDKWSAMKIHMRCKWVCNKMHLKYTGDAMEI